MKHELEEIDYYLRLLFPICRSLTGKGNRDTLQVLKEIVPLKVLEIPSGQVVYDWIVPDEWWINDAWIEDSNGNRIVDFSENNLHIVGYSAPVYGEYTWEELRKRIHKHSKLSRAIPYRTSYYKRDWGFCVTGEQYDFLSNTNGSLKVCIDSGFYKGSLSIGELLVRGASSQEILISSYICHPSMANDSLSGVVLTALLARWIMRKEDLRYSYRIVFAPETIGAIAYLKTREEAMKQVSFGLVVTTVGGVGKLGYKKSYDDTHELNRFVEESLIETGEEFMIYPFDIHGSDERQYSAPGFRINTCTICRDKYYEYDFYHTSLDNLDFVKAESVEKTLNVYKALISKLESREVYKVVDLDCEKMLSKYSLYPTSGGAQLPKPNILSETDIVLWLLFLCDGEHSIRGIASRIKCEESRVREVAQKLCRKGLMRHV